MRNVLLLGVTFLFLCTAVVSANPTTMPTDRKAVVVLPFTEIAEQGAAWIGKGIQQNLIADIGRLPGVRVLPRDDEQPASMDRALQIARDARAAYLITGSYQRENGDLRCFGQIVDVSSGEIIGTLKTTGPMVELFAIQDALSEQARRQLGPTITANRTTPLGPGPQPVINPTPPLQNPVTGRFVGSSLQAWLETSINSRDFYNRYIFGQTPRYSDYDYYPSNYGYSRNYGYGYGLGYPIYGGYPFAFSRVIIIKGHGHHHHHHSHGDVFTPPTQVPHNFAVPADNAARPQFRNYADLPRMTAQPQFRNYAELPRLTAQSQFPQSTRFSGNSARPSFSNQAAMPHRNAQNAGRNFAAQPRNVAQSR